MCPAAMQNWGLLMFDERRLLYNEVRFACLSKRQRCVSLRRLAAFHHAHDPSSQGLLGSAVIPMQAWEGAYGLQQVVNVICHEVAHQW